VEVVLEQARKEEWASRLRDRAQAQAATAQPHDAAEANVLALQGRQRSLANHAQVGLARFERDLQNLGLTEPQIHEIIPDRPRPKKAAEDVLPGSPTPPAPAAAPAPVPVPATPAAT
jgi:hypothetical protein